MQKLALTLITVRIIGRHRRRPASRRLLLSYERPCLVRRPSDFGLQVAQHWPCMIKGQQIDHAWSRVWRWTMVRNLEIDHAWSRVWRSTMLMSVKMGHGRPCGEEVGGGGQVVKGSIRMTRRSCWRALAPWWRRSPRCRRLSWTTGASARSSSTGAPAPRPAPCPALSTSARAPSN